MKALREVYGETLVKLGEENSSIVVLDADLSKSTKTDLFRNRFPDRFFDMGISEQDMFATAAGMAAAGAIPFVSTFAVFAAGRAYEQIRNSICYPNLNVKIVATHAGLTVGEDGATHQMLEDIGLMRVLPNMKVFMPSDAVETKELIEAIVNIQGPVYVRLPRIKLPDILPENYKFDFLGEPAIIKTGTDGVIITAGVMLSESLKASQELEKNNISLQVINFSTIKPLNKNFLDNISKNNKIIITVEEHSKYCGLGAAVAELVSSFGYNNILQIIGVDDKFGESGDSNDLLKKYGLDFESLIIKIENIFKNQ